MGFFIKRGISYSTYFINQKEAAKFLGIKNSSKKAINARCRQLQFEAPFDEPEPYGSIKNLNHTKYSM